MISLLTKFFFALSLVGLYYPSSTTADSSTQGCRCFPTDSCWPSAQEWQDFNTSVGGRLIATLPIGAVCHNSAFGTYDAAACSVLKSNWFYPQTHLPSSSSIMASYFANNSCNPFLSPDIPCALGNLILNAVNASSASDIMATISFVREHNIRFVVRNTGHDYNGKSTGAGAVAIWTHYLQDMQIIDYTSSFYTGKALKMAAGVMVEDAYKFTQASGLVNVGGNCPTLGMAGGYTQGGGHGPLASNFGLAADQTLEWEVITGTGEMITATPTEYPDVYWALSGGGGSTYGVVCSLTVRVYPDLITTGANFTFTSTGVDPDDYWNVAGTFLGVIPTLLKNNCYASWLLTSQVISVGPMFCPELDTAETTASLQPVFDQLTQYNIACCNYYDSYIAYSSGFNVSQYQIGGRLIPVATVEQNSTQLLSIIRSSCEDYGLIASAVILNASTALLPPGGNSVTPAWRAAAFDFLLGTAYNYTDYQANADLANAMTDTYLPPVEKLTPNSGVYVNEADFQQPNYQQQFYGGNYDCLLQIKDQYDPDQIFYAITAVGSDR